MYWSKRLKNSVKYTYQVRAIAELKAIKDAEDVYKALGFTDNDEVQSDFGSKITIF